MNCFCLYWVLIVGIVVVVGVGVVLSMCVLIELVDVRFLDFWGIVSFNWLGMIILFFIKGKVI